MPLALLDLPRAKDLTKKKFHPYNEHEVLDWPRVRVKGE